MTNNDLGPVYGLFFAVILLLLLSGISNTHNRILTDKAVKSLYEYFSENVSFDTKEVYPQNNELYLPEFKFSKGQ